MKPWLHIVGVGQGGIGELAPAQRDVIAAARHVIGPQRLLAELAAEAPAGAERQNHQPWASPLAAMLDQIAALRGKPSAVLATGDPMWFGIGSTLAAHLPEGEYAVHPFVSAFQLAAARLSWPLQSVATLSLHGRPVDALHPHLFPGNRILALTSDGSTISAACALLAKRGFGASRVTILEHLGGTGERITSVAAAAFEPGSVGDFHVLAILCASHPHIELLPAIPGLPDAAFLSDGQLTKREVRAVTLARLAPYPGAVLWDVGAGCGSISIEWLRCARGTRAFAFEREATRCELIAGNARALGVPQIELVRGEAPASFAGCATPDAVFLGGDIADEDLFAAGWDALRGGGRLVANAVTVEGETALYERQARYGGELSRLDVSVLDHIGGHRVMRPRMAVTQWQVAKP